ncbi:MAG: nicotinate-nucleotide adenylyltransferase [Thermoleophilaceae bacterium]|jgi:nicotinate-nucleotide adenylyltransferase|nr:nicotinate-nucleotide adenylyltransferase [Thermoleophilaceae bacterium]
MLGGAFNPPHIGHLALAQEARARLGLDEVLLMPMARAPHREIEPEPGAEVRLRLTELAVQGDVRLSACPIEVDRGGRSYTVETLRALRDRGPADERFLILGGDAAAGLPAWREPEEVLRLATVAVAEREGWESERVRETLDGLEGSERVVYFEMPRFDVSSSLVRRRAAEGLPVRYFVPDLVAEEIAERGLYSREAVNAS